MEKSVKIRMRDAAQDPHSTVSQAAMVLAQGGVVAIPTETVYGLMVIHGNDAALQTLRKIKGRDSGKPFQILIAEIEEARQLGAVISPLADRIMREFWPGPLTIVLPAAGGHSIGLRLPASDMVRRIIRKTGSPLVATSANPANQPPAATARDVETMFAGQVDLIVDSGLQTTGIASTVIRVNDFDLEILRPGAINNEQLRQVMDSMCQCAS